jgi:hypothetical protein
MSALEQQRGSKPSFRMSLLGVARPSWMSLLRFIPLGGFMSGYITDIRAIDLDSFKLFWANIGSMKVVALVAGLVAGGYYIDSTFYHGRYFRAASAVTHQITMHFGLR